MTGDLIEELYLLNKKIKETEQELKIMKDDRNALVYQIKHDKVTSPNYHFEAKGTTRVNPQWFKQHAPEFYRTHAHVSHPDAVALMCSITGSYADFMAFVRNAKEQDFDRMAVITLEDIKNEYGENVVDELLEEGALRKEENFSFTCKPKLAYEIEQEKARV